MSLIILLLVSIGSIEWATKWLRILSIPLNDKIRNHLVANPILQSVGRTVEIEFCWKIWNIRIGNRDDGVDGRTWRRNANESDSWRLTMTGHARAFRIKINARSWSVVAGRPSTSDHTDESRSHFVSSSRFLVGTAIRLLAIARRESFERRERSWHVALRCFCGSSSESSVAAVHTFPLSLLRTTINLTFMSRK